MTNQEAAQYNLQRAQIILDEAEHLREQGAMRKAAYHQNFFTSRKTPRQL